MKTHNAKNDQITFCGRKLKSSNLTKGNPDCEVCLSRIEETQIEKNVPFHHFFKGAGRAPSIGIHARKVEKQLASLKKMLAETITQKDHLLHENEEKFNDGFCLALVLLVRSYEPLSEHAFHIFQEAGYEYVDFISRPLNPEDREALKKIFSI